MLATKCPREQYESMKMIPNRVTKLLQIRKLLLLVVFEIL